VLQACQLAFRLFSRRSDKAIDGEHGAGVIARGDRLAYLAQLRLRIVKKLDQVGMIQTALHHRMSSGRSRSLLVTEYAHLHGLHSQTVKNVQFCALPVAVLAEGPIREIIPMCKIARI
jgi:hypothetical protein